MTSNAVPLARARSERTFWVLDMLAYLFLAVAALDGGLHPNGYVSSVVQDRSWIIALWLVLPVGGGLIAFVGRLSRVWVIEYVANHMAAWGAGLYAVILVPAITQGQAVGIFALVVIAMIAMMRRYAELRLFSSEPTQQRGLRTRVLTALRRRFHGGDDTD